MVDKIWSLKIKWHSIQIWNFYARCKTKYDIEQKYHQINSSSLESIVVTCLNKINSIQTNMLLCNKLDFEQLKFGFNTKILVLLYKVSSRIPFLLLSFLILSRFYFSELWFYITPTSNCKFIFNFFQYFF